MKQIIEQQLLGAGVQIEEGARRFAGNYALYERFLDKFPDDPTFGALELAVEQQNWQDILTAAHTLKGVAGNLSMERLFCACSEMVALLRADDHSGALQSYETVKRSYEAIIRALRPREE